MDLGDPDLAAGKEPRDPVGSGAVERIHENAHVGGGQAVQVDVGSDEIHVTGVWVVALDEAGGLCVGERPVGDLPAGIRRDERLDGVEHLRTARGARG